MEFAVVDVETTGVLPGLHHRICEIGVVVLDRKGEVIEEWDTLVNPERDIATTEIHGLDAATLMDAPRFADIAADVVAILRGRVLAAHNLAFDARFLAYELDRSRARSPITTTFGVCTMRLASRYLGVTTRSLPACCEAAGVKLEDEHHALADARGAAGLLNAYMTTDRRFGQSIGDRMLQAQSALWPDIGAPTGRRVRRESFVGRPRPHFLAQLADKGTRRIRADDAAEYLDVLTQALLDRRVSRHEEQELVALADELGLSRAAALDLHRRWLLSLAAVAWEDHVITGEERSDLENVAALLGLPASAVDEALTEVQREGRTSAAPAAVAHFELEASDVVVLTGGAPGRERPELVAEAEALGLEVAKSVRKDTKVLVAKDIDSMSGKAKRARDIKVPIIDYPTYFAAIAALRDD